MKDGKRIYKGEGNIQFTAYWPYAHTPDKVKDGANMLDGKKAISYKSFLNINEWKETSGLDSTKAGSCEGENYGNLPAPFVLSKTGFIDKDTEIRITDSLYIKTSQETYNLKWDSKTGIVSGTDPSGNETSRKAVPVMGKTIGGLPVGENSIDISGATLSYHYWYY